MWAVNSPFSGAGLLRLDTLTEADAIAFGVGEVEVFHLVIRYLEGTVNGHAAGEELGVEAVDVFHDGVDGNRAKSGIALSDAEAGQVPFDDGEGDRVLPEKADLETQRVAIPLGERFDVAGTQGGVGTEKAWHAR